MGCNAQRVEGVDVVDEAIGGTFFFFLEGAEQSVPDNEYPTVVTIQILYVTPVVHAVMTRRVKEPFYGPPKLTNGLGVDPELIDEAHATKNGNHDWMEPQKRQRGLENERSGDRTRPGLP